MKKIMFIWPGIYLGWCSLGKGFENSSINHGLSAISAVLKDAGHACFLVDMRSFKDWNHFEKVIKEQQFDICAVGFHSVDETTADQAIRIIKKLFPKKPVIAGGVHLTFKQQTEFSLADCVVWGEGDEVMLELVDKIALGEPLPRQVTAPRIKDLDCLPFVDRGLFNSEYEKDNPFLPLLGKPFYTVNFSRGCNYSCAFCLESKNLLWKGQQTRSPENCVAELAGIHRGAPGIGGLMIHDDNFPSRRKWVEGFIAAWDQCLPRIPWWCQMRADTICKNADLIPELARLGMTWVSLGIEGSPRMLEFYNKKVTAEQIIRAAAILHENSINIFGNYIMGAPTETREDIEALGKMLAEIRPTHHSASTYTAYPGSKLYDYCVENKLLVGDGTKKSDYYCLTRYPYERKIVGVDYDYIHARQAEFSQKYRREVMRYQPQPRPVSIPAELVATTSAPPDSTSPLVTIITLSHNRPVMLSEAINSILAQTIGNWEMIIIDDFSTNPDVPAVLEEAAKDPRIRVYRANYDVDNVSLLWNMAIERARGKYIAFLDDDNRKKPEFCAEMSAWLDAHPERDAVACFNELIHASGSQRKTRGELFTAPKDATKENILTSNYIDSGCMMIRRQLVEKIGWFDERLRAEDDWDYVIRIMHEANGFGIIEKPLAEYRWHGENRIYRSQSLGYKEGHKFILEEKKYGTPLKLLVVHRDEADLTLSQNNVLRGIREALAQIPWLAADSCAVSHLAGARKDYDIVFVVMPFCIPAVHIPRVKALGARLVNFHCEDPQAIEANGVWAAHADYVFTNDRAALARLEKITGPGRCGFCPSVSVNDVSLIFRESAPKKYDVIFYGYAYASRVAFVREFIKKYPTVKMTLVGGGWADKEIKLPALGELSEQESIRVMEESKIVVMRSRCHTDLGGKADALVPESLVRGYFEAAAGSLIMINDARPHSSLNSEAVYYSGVDDLRQKIDEMLRDEKAREEIARRAKEKALTQWTYKKRVTEMLNAVRSMRYYQEVA